MPVQDNKRIQRVKHFAEMVKGCGGDAKKLEQVVASADIQHVVEEFTKALTNAKKIMDSLQPGLAPESSKQRLDIVLNLINSVAEISPLFKTGLRTAGLYLIKAEYLQANNAKLQQLKDAVTATLQANVLEVILEDLIKELNAAKQLSAEQTQELINGLKLSLKQVDMGRYAIEISNSNIMYDPYRKLGALLAAIYFMNIGADLEDEHHPDAKVAPHEPLDKNRAYAGLRRTQTGAPA